jgi:hypothetical protein
VDDDAREAIGTVLAAIGGILERGGVCSTEELANTLGGVAMMTRDAGPQYHNRAAYIGSWAMMVKAAADGPPQVN